MTWSITQISVSMAQCLDYLTLRGDSGFIDQGALSHPGFACLDLHPLCSLNIIPAQFQHHKCLVSIEQGVAICPHARNKQKRLPGENSSTGQNKQMNPGTLTPAYSLPAALKSSSSSTHPKDSQNKITAPGIWKSSCSLLLLPPLHIAWKRKAAGTGPGVTAERSP